MQVTIPIVRFRKLPFNWALLASLTALLLIVVGSELWRSWMNDSSLSFAPLMPLIAIGLLWQKRDKLQNWNVACPNGLTLLIASCLLYVASVWADIEALKPLMLIGILAGIVQFLGGFSSLWTTTGALGLLLFTIPWPTTLIGRLQFPLQLLSSTYAGMFAGMLGLPIEREGVSLAVVPDPTQPAIYRIVVAQQCSGLTSLIVLLALGYLIAYHTPIKLWARACLFLVTIPLALFANAVRLTFVLAAGANHGAAMAMWVHDHEQPILVFFCTLGLVVLRHFLLQAKMLVLQNKLKMAQVVRTPKRESFLYRNRTTAVNVLIVLTLMGGFWGRRIESASASSVNLLSSLELPFRNWKQSNFKLTSEEAGILQPDSVLLRRYKDQNGMGNVELAVIAGHRKKTVHTPDYCLIGGGWETLSQRDIDINLPSGPIVPAVRSWMVRDGKQMICTYFFTDGEFSTRSLPQFQFSQISKRLRGNVVAGALVRIIVPMQSSPQETEGLGDDFGVKTLPAILDRMKSLKLSLR